MKTACGNKSNYYEYHSEKEEMKMYIPSKTQY